MNLFPCLQYSDIPLVYVFKWLPLHITKRKRKKKQKTLKISYANLYNLVLPIFYHTTDEFRTK